MNKKIELLAPAGDMNALRAAVQNGADAVYFGAGNFNARRNASNFEGDALFAAVAYCHVRGVKTHLTLNTLVREDELPMLEDTIRTLNLSGADAVIVQDVGVARAIRQIAPQLELHASTQMAVHNRQGVDFLVANGFKRVVLAREMTHDEMAACAGRGAEIEVFAHGALCVACSGQCLMSSMVGGRSGNRGLCAQPCRLPWTMGDREGYLLSTGDLCSLEALDKLQAAGVDSIKIEGRLKRAEYVAETTATYRRALDALYAERKDVNLENEKTALKQMFNRGGFTQGYGQGVEDVELMYAARPNHIGVCVGESHAVGEVVLSADVELADVLVLRREGAEDVPVKLSGQMGERVKCSVARRGDGLFRLVSEVQMKAARESFNGERRKTPIRAQVVLRVGEPAQMLVSDGEYTAQVQGEAVALATGRGADAERITAQLNKTGGTAYEIADLSLALDAEAFCPASMLNALRRDALNALESLRVAVDRENHALVWPAKEVIQTVKPRLLAQSGSVEILKRALACGADLAVFAPEDVRRLPEDALPDRFALAVPAVLTEASLSALFAWASRHADRIEMTYLSNIGHFALDWPGAHAADYLLNIANEFSIAQMKDWGIGTYTPSVELNCAQIARLGCVRDLIMWGRIPLMQLRHCPLRATQGMRGKHSDCNRCDHGNGLLGQRLNDRKAMEFPLVRIATPGGCVIQMLNSAHLMPLRKLDRMPEAQCWRLLLREDEPIETVLRVYRAAIDGEDFRALSEWTEIEAMNTTTGHYFRGVE